MLLQYLKYYFFSFLNPQMACMINSRRTVKTEHPFTGKHLNRHHWSSVEETKKDPKKRPNICPLLSLKDHQKQMSEYPPVFNKTSLKLCCLYTEHILVDSCTVAFFFLVCGYVMLDKSTYIQLKIIVSGTLDLELTTACLCSNLSLNKLQAHKVRS